MDFDVALMSAEDWAALEEWQLREAQQQYMGYLAVLDAGIRAVSEEMTLYTEAKLQGDYDLMMEYAKAAAVTDTLTKELNRKKAIASHLQTRLRSKV